MRGGQTEVGPHRGESGEQHHHADGTQRPAAAPHAAHGAGGARAPIPALQPDVHRRHRVPLRLQRAREHEGGPSCRGRVRRDGPDLEAGHRRRGASRLRAHRAVEPEDLPRCDRRGSTLVRQRLAQEDGAARGRRERGGRHPGGDRRGARRRGLRGLGRRGWRSELRDEPREGEAVGRLAGGGNEGLEVGVERAAVGVPGVAVLRQETIEDGLNRRGQGGHPAHRGDGRVIEDRAHHARVAARLEGHAARAAARRAPRPARRGPRGGRAARRASCSGAMYATLPLTVPACVWWLWSARLGDAEVHQLHRAVDATRMLCGLTSRCTRFSGSPVASSREVVRVGEPLARRGDDRARRRPQRRSATGARARCGMSRRRSAPWMYSMAMK